MRDQIAELKSKAIASLRERQKRDTRELWDELHEDGSGQYGSPQPHPLDLRTGKERRRRRRESNRRLKKACRETWKERRLFGRKVLPFIQPIGRDDVVRQYCRWLEGFLDNGGELGGYIFGSVYDDSWRIATDSLTITPAYGQNLVKIIVPAGITVTGVTGHCQVYLIDGFGYMGWGRVCVYSDTEV